MTLPPRATVVIPPALHSWALAVQLDAPHPAWEKMGRRGRYLRLSTTSLDDLTELADWARTSLVEPEKPLARAQKAAFQSVLQRTGRWAHIELLGHCHCLATSWKQSHKQS
jgi:hypothetical protein